MYISRDEILASIPEPVLRDALDDNGDGLEDDGRLDTIIAGACEECDGLVASRFTVPFATTPALIKSAAHCFACAAIYARRRVPESANPFAKDADYWRSVLRDIGAGNRQIDAAQAISLAAGAGGNPLIPGRVPASGDDTTYQ